MEQELASRERLKASCNDLEGRLKQLRKEAASFQVPPAESTIQRLRAEECFLRAQLSTLQENPPTAGSLDKRVLHQRAIEDVQRCNEGLEQTLRHMEGQKKLLHEQLETYTEEEKQLRSLQQCFQPPSDSQPDLADLEELNLYRQRSRELEEHLLDFLETYYPQPTPEDTAGRQKRGRRPGGRSAIDEPSRVADIESLQELLEKLSSKAIRHPEDPYVTLSENTWPQYVELLRRSGIITEHADDSTRIKLVHGHV